MVARDLNAPVDRVCELLVATACRLPRRFKSDRSGIAAVEFALLLPIMIMLYVGGIEITDAYTIDRKVTGVASALSDLVAQSKKITTNEMQNILDASESIMAPYAVGDLKVRVSGVWIDDQSVAKVVWSVARNETAAAEDSVMTLPSGVTDEESFLVVAEAEYDYTPKIGYVLTGALTLGQEFYLKPRLSKTVCYNDKCELD
jgi:Flp pilus assembly protein TadG